MTVAERIAAIRHRIDSACARSGRPGDDVTLVAVSKTHPVDRVLEAQDAGQIDFGESYAKELREKAAAVAAPVRWHFVGRLQSNKARDVAAVASVIHSVDRPGLVEALDRAAQHPIDVLIQVNSGGELSKGGCRPDEAAALVRLVAASRYLRPVGLMTLPPPSDNPDDMRPWFAALRSLRDVIAAELAAVMPEQASRFVHLSMGMSDDLEVAVEEGATLVRVGTAIFGARRPA